MILEPDVEEPVSFARELDEREYSHAMLKAYDALSPTDKNEIDFLAEMLVMGVRDKYRSNHPEGSSVQFGMTQAYHTLAALGRFMNGTELQIFTTPTAPIINTPLTNGDNNV